MLIRLSALFIVFCCVFAALMLLTLAIGII